MKRGWCPGVHEPMASGDGLLIRVKPFGGKLSAGALRTLAVVAAGCGNGAVELTGRGNLQLRGLTEVTARLAARMLVEAGLADPSPEREARRNVIAVPPCDDALVTAIETMMVQIEGLAPKFCIAVGAARADIQVLADRIVAGDQDIPLSRIAGEAAPAPPSAAVRERAIPDAVRDLAETAGGRLLAVRRVAETAQPLPPGLLLGLPFGQTDASALMRLADVMDGATLRTTPWRSFFLQGAQEPAPFAAAGFITDLDDPRRSIAACAGAPACGSASVPARADAAFLAAQGLRDIHVSGCGKGCAHPYDAVTLVGSGGSYGLVRRGRAGDRPSLIGLTIAQAAEVLA